MPTDMNHERMRWSSMTFAQLEQRLRKITVPNKLTNFIHLCREHWNDPLKRGDRLCPLARDRAANLGLRYAQQMADSLINAHDREFVQNRDRSYSIVNRPPAQSTQDVLATGSRMPGQTTARNFERVRTSLLGLYVVVAQESNFAVCHCSLCSAVIVRVGLLDVQGRIGEAASMIRTHEHVCRTRVQDPEEVPQPKIRVIRMGGNR